MFSEDWKHESDEIYNDTLFSISADHLTSIFLNVYCVVLPVSKMNVQFTISMVICVPKWEFPCTYGAGVTLAVNSRGTEVQYMLIRCTVVSPLPCQSRISSHLTPTHISLPYMINRHSYDKLNLWSYDLWSCAMFIIMGSSVCQGGSQKHPWLLRGQ